MLNTESDNSIAKNLLKNKLILDKNDFRIKRKKKFDKLLYLLNFKLHILNT